MTQIESDARLIASRLMDPVDSPRESTSVLFDDLYEMAKALLLHNQLPVESPAINGCN